MIHEGPNEPGLMGLRPAAVMASSSNFAAGSRRSLLGEDEQLHSLSARGPEATGKLKVACLLSPAVPRVDSDGVDPAAGGVCRILRRNRIQMNQSSGLSHPEEAALVYRARRFLKTNDSFLRV